MVKVYATTVAFHAEVHLAIDSITWANTPGVLGGSDIMKFHAILGKSIR